MKAKKLILPLFFLNILFLNSCAKESSFKLKDAKLILLNPPVVQCGIDGSRSYNYFEASKDKFRKFIKTLPDETLFCMRWITHDSYLPSNAIVTLNLPSLKIESGINVFDKRQKIKYALQKREFLRVQEEILMKINRAQNPRSDYTDILGFLVLCSERIKQFNGREVYILISSDLKNNVNKYLQYLNKDSLKSAHIFILAYEHTNPEFRIVWTERFKNWGAKEIRYFAPDEEMPNFFERSFIAGGSLEKNHEKREK